MRLSRHSKNTVLLASILFALENPFAFASNCAELLIGLDFRPKSMLFDHSHWIARKTGKPIRVLLGNAGDDVSPSRNFGTFETDQFITKEGHLVLFRSINQEYDRNFHKESFGSREKYLKYPEFFSVHPLGIRLYRNKNWQTAHVIIALQNAFTDSIDAYQKGVGYLRPLMPGSILESEKHDKVRLKRGTSNVIAQISESDFWRIVDTMPAEVELGELLRAIAPVWKPISP